MPIRTELTRRLDLRYPILAAPLGRGSTPSFLGALARNGSFGFAPFVHLPVEEIASTVGEYAEAAGGYDRFGFNLVLLGDQRARLDAALEAGCQIVSLLRGDPAVYVTRAKQAGAMVFWTATNPDEARSAATAGADFIMVQGREGGGHLTGQASLMTMLPAISDAVPGVPLVATGGVADGRGLAAAIALGATGVCLGTRFVASLESGCHRGHKIKVTEAGFGDLLETTLFDGGWPNSPHRVLRNSTVARWEAYGRPPSGSRPDEGEEIGRFPDGRPILRYNVATPWAAMQGKWEAGPLYAGESAALIDSVETIPSILTRTTIQAEEIMRRNLTLHRQ